MSTGTADYARALSCLAEFNKTYIPASPHPRFAEPAADSPLFIYFAQRGEGGPIKIGKSTKVERRVESLQTGCAERLILIGYVPAGRLTEMQVHNTLAAHRLAGEWFMPHADVLAMIQMVLTGEEWLGIGEEPVGKSGKRRKSAGKNG